MTVTGARYHDITDFFLTKLNDMDVENRHFQQDYMTCHTASETIELLHETFLVLFFPVISIGPPIIWFINTTGFFSMRLFEVKGLCQQANIDPCIEGGDATLHQEIQLHLGKMVMGIFYKGVLMCQQSRGCAIPYITLSYQIYVLCVIKKNTISILRDYLRHPLVI